MSTVISFYGFDLTFQGTLVEGTDYGFYEVCGSPWVLDSGSGVILEARSPATTTNTSGTVINGAEINPGFVNPTVNSFGAFTVAEKVGWDARITVTNSPLLYYESAKNATLSLPKTLYAGESLVVAESLSPNTDPLVGANPSAVKKMVVYTIVDAVPSAGDFRPTYAGTTKTVWNKSDVDLTKIVSVSSTFDPVGSGLNDFRLDDSDAYLGNPTTYPTEPQSFKGMHYKMIPKLNGVGITITQPTNQQQVYPANYGKIFGQNALYSSSSWDINNVMLYRLIQHGIDCWGCYQTSPSQAADGGAGFYWRWFWPILFAGYYLNNSAMLNYAFDSYGFYCFNSHEFKTNGECDMQYYGANGDLKYRLPRPRSSYPNGIPLQGNHWTSDLSVSGNGFNGQNRDPDGQYDGMSGWGSTNHRFVLYPYKQVDGSNTFMSEGGSYMQFQNANIPMYIWAHIHGLVDKLNNRAAVDYFERWCNDPGMWGNFGMNDGVEAHIDRGSVNALKYDFPENFNNDRYLIFRATVANDNTSVDVTISVNGAEPKPLYNTYDPTAVKFTVGQLNASETWYVFVYIPDIDCYVKASRFSANIAYFDYNAGVWDQNFGSDANGFGGSGNGWVKEVYNLNIKAKMNAGAAAL